ncbi:bifunctional DNA-formamidopyrimidine glycosylase/DNA-(apurinic or apyrimidinic site) lyase [Longimicrobium sp.]|uniref:bifunctional DNA-formamidopyrimidine glycosylase/DNA-(apurinic or apyrimidinic site) lyase n=1 Tax=Longimicrobium sp. TaxID=2029185 RepID=UPI002E369B2E|nr:bifunctional DNA-formamidopyrimidine glycosylase/DNA-(apurinic or apyrimidinic site) lyase [Longimicrobium sp.]HEX6039787.1 bifunctional DNA-formamidopyrimidine glycosylase/DNA-(apurinic or apyrimidinic site) lyase [Longimicrobium sp.]
MPELPEVETIVRDLAHLLPGAKIKGVEVVRPDLIEDDTPEGFARKIRGKKIRSVVRRAKNIVMDLGGERLLVNLGMTGRLLVARAGDDEPTHLGVRIGLDRGRELRYHDVRRFGRLWTVTEAQWQAWDGQLGVEPLSDAFSADWLVQAAGRSKVAIKVWLMDQARVVGVGNIYASEALFRARVDPRRPANSLTPDELARVRDGVQAVLREAIDHRGTTFLDYRDARGEEGAFAARLKVYDREGQPCPGCKGHVERIVQGGRSTFFCPSCQH